MAPFLLALLLLATLSLSAPSTPNLVYPLAAQLPPTARTEQIWSWTLLPGTFNASSGSTLSLSSRDLPAWAQFDANTWTFSGLPNVADLGSQLVTVQANASGAAEGISSVFELVVVETGLPYVRLSIEEQLPTAASFADGADLTPDGALEIPPTWSFSLGFQQYTFENANRDRIYYDARLAGTTSLPSWLNFDNRTVTFDGVAPRETGEYEITIYGSERFGHGDVVQTLKLSIGYHSLELLDVIPALNATPTQEINYVVPLTNLRIDNSTIESANLSSVSVDLTALPYLSYDPATLVISGQVPDSLVPSTIPILVVFTDLFNETIEANITLNIFPALFESSSLPTLNVLAGKAFSDDLSSYARSEDANYTATISPTDAQSWLDFDPSSLVLSGTPPAVLPSYNASILLTATDSSRGISGTSTLLVALFAKTLPPSTPSASSSSGLSRAAKLAIGLTLGIIGALLLLALLFFCCKRYRADDERRLRRDGSTLIFDDAALAVAAAVEKPASITKAERTAEANASQGWGNPEVGRRTIADDTFAAQEAAMAAAAMGEEEGKPKRFDLMAMFKGAPKKEASRGSLPISQNSLYGLGMADTSPTQHNIVVVTDSHRAGTYVARDETTSDRLGRDGESDLAESSSWESRGSSSLFYSEASDSARKPRPLPPSAPRQRRDFVPLYPRASTSAGSPSPSPHVTPSPPQAVDRNIRAVAPDPESSGSERDLYDASRLPQPLDDHSYDDLVASSDSDFSLPVPRLIPFTNHGKHTDTVADAKRYSSQRAVGTSNRDSAMEDAVEDAEEEAEVNEDADEGGWDRHDSGLYEPERETGTPTTSAIFFATPRVSDYEPSPPGGIRVVNSFTPSNYEPASPNPRTHRRTETASTYYDPVRIAVQVNETFRFTPRLNPPPFVSITSSPGRGGPPRATYHAYLEAGDEESDRSPLPEWLHFDSRSLEIWGCAGPAEAAGVSAVVIVERKEENGSPSRGGRAESELVVARYELEVEWGDEEEGDVGQLQVITY